ncbi:hypothetical protein [Natrarchaeobaculum sulfurireducens]|uniref:Uncharacterized protein n=1 Tax=Natrarchaeobaculum sulfurireducens TaxID=2044521 RepID=A0A346PJ14_9EURY|nr:hypothetical protein [Natrarchaeobaculum sulfurireducens]AXR79509.1 hypothetical protein AArc1_3204 [Natrarchaeobaculum sulfurireducens]
MYRAADDDGVSYGQIDRAVRTIDDLDGPAKTRAERLVRETDGDGLRLVDEMDGGVLDTMLRLEVSNADAIRAQLARLAAADSDLFDVARSEQFARDADRLAGSGVRGFDDGPGSLIDEIPTYRDAGNLRGAQYELRVAVASGDVEDLQSVARVVTDNDGNRITDIDVERPGRIIEAKNTIRVRQANDKLDSFDQAHRAGEIDLDGKTVQFTKTHRLTQQQQSEIRQTARAIEQNPDNGVNSITVEFEELPPVEG